MKKLFAGVVVALFVAGLAFTSPAQASLPRCVEDCGPTVPCDMVCLFNHKAYTCGYFEECSEYSVASLPQEEAFLDSLAVPSDELQAPVQEPAQAQQEDTPTVEAPEPQD